MIRLHKRFYNKEKRHKKWIHIAHIIITNKKNDRNI